MELAEAYRRSVADWVERVHEVGSDQWDQPTPCSDWTVRQLVNHVVGEDLWTAPLVQGKTIAEVGDAFDGDLLGDDPLSIARDAAALAVDAVSAGLPAGGTVHLSYGDEDLGEYIHQLFADHVVHGWDLAAAVGADRAINDDLIGMLAPWYADREEMYRGAGIVADRPDGDGIGSAQSELLAAFGRKADWSA